VDDEAEKQEGGFTCAGNADDGRCRRRIRRKPSKAVREEMR